MNCASFTICAFNYLSKAIALVDSYRKFHSDDDFYIFIVGSKFDSFQLPKTTAKIIFVEDLNIKNYFNLAFKFDVIEFSTYLKPVLFQHLFKSYESVFYIDPDIMFFSSLETAKFSLKNNIGVLTPHTFTPVDDDKKPADLDFLRFGTYNLGFIGLKRCETAINLVEWWEQRLSKYGFYEPQSGMAVDQKWLDLAVAFFPGLKILEHLGYNVAFWNLHERKISENNQSWFVNENTSLVFIHFSSFNLTDSSVVAEKQDRFLAGSRPDFSKAADMYRQLLIKSDTGLNSKPYDYDYFQSGDRISITLRRIYSYSMDLVEANPFAKSSRTYQFAQQNNLLCSGHLQRSNFKALGTYSKMQSVVIFGLKIALRILGPDRYYMLMRYLSHISSFQNQLKLLLPVSL